MSSLVDTPKAYTMVGDPHYMAPEQISGQGYGYGVDYWSLGILLFAMLHVETPFAQHTSETQVRHRQTKRLQSSGAAYTRSATLYNGGEIA